MQLEDKVFYIFGVFILLWLMVVILSSCTSSIYKVRKEYIEVTHVLALTNAGDTVKIPINEIKPQLVYNVVGYNFYNPYQYDRYRNNLYDRYYNYNRNYGHYQGAQSSGFGVQYNNISPSTQPTSSGIVGGSGTSGFSGNPVASNPVTSTGGGKKNN